MRVNIYTVQNNSNKLYRRIIIYFISERVLLSITLYRIFRLRFIDARARVYSVFSTSRANLHDTVLNVAILPSAFRDILQRTRNSFYPYLLTAKIA